MASAKKKRSADNYLTDQNWDQEETESANDNEGATFKEASEEVLASRTFVKGKRRGEAGDTTGVQKISNPFGAFGGFTNQGLKPIENKAKVTFGSEKGDRKPNGVSSQNFWTSNKTKVDFFANRGNTNDTKNIENTPNNNNNDHAESQKSAELDKNSELKSNAEENLYLQELSALNISVLEWIKQHVEENPCIDLTPVFNDYGKHLKDVESKHLAKKNTPIFKSPANTNSSVFKSPVTISPMIKNSGFAVQKTAFTSSTPIIKNGLEGKAPVASLSIPSKSVIPEKTEAAEGEEEPSDESVVPERKTIVEEDAFHQIRSKLFFKKGESFQELGVGMLYLKWNNDKIQLLIRMENATGKILLNVQIIRNTPMSRKGKNNVMLVTVPNPPVYLKPTDGDNSLPCTYLIRVKTAGDADTLLEKMQSKRD